MRKAINIIGTFGLWLYAQVTVLLTTNRSEQAKLMYESACDLYSADILSDDELDEIWDRCRINVVEYAILCMLAVAINDPEETTLREYRWGTSCLILVMIGVVYLLPFSVR